jgi:hypothetical protein
MKTVKVLDPIQAVSSVTGKPQQRRVVILQRNDGHFSFAEEYFYKSEHDGQVVAEGWQQLPPEGIFLNAEIAEEEARRFLQSRRR